MFDNTQDKDFTGSQSNPIKNISAATSPLTPRKSANRLYGGYNQPSGLSFSSFPSNIDCLDLLKDFCAYTKKQKSITEIWYHLHNITISKLGFNFTAFGAINKQSKYINIKLSDRIGNVFSSKVFLTDETCIIAECINYKTIKTIDNIDFLKIPYLSDSNSIVFPLIAQDECVGVFIAGTTSLQPNNCEILSVLVDYMAASVMNSCMVNINGNTDTDVLTGTKSHKAFQEALTEELEQAKANSTPVSVLIFDIINISQINREFGHAKGDEIIKIVAEKIKQNARNIDVVGRYGGDEIAVILPNLDNSEAGYIAEYLNYILSCTLVDDVGPVKVSIGLATYPYCTQDQEKLLILAEQAMMISKGKGYKNGLSSLVNAQEIDFWNDTALNSFAEVIAKRHNQLGINFEDELVDKFHHESIKSNNHLLDVVTSLAGAIDAKDTYTKGHSLSVSRYSEALARALKLPEKEVERIKLGALLHDVGKIGIPENVLKKPSCLTDDEWQIMKQHPVIGVEKVLGPIESLRDLLPLVKYHHEHWDGTGYPEGLKGEEIPYTARIVAIADAFHALISDRPYRKGLSIDKAIEILRIGAGIQWDKDLVREFIIIAPSLSTKV